jgi:EAL domain-containing protein (putative c-di-GMP-specific phosphodiesterase class I)
VADRVALEITETTPLFAIGDLRGRLAELKRLGFHLALHDLGAASPALSTFARIHPEIVKLDRSLVRGIDRDAAKQKHLRSLINLCGDLGIHVVAQGVETVAERAALVAVGCDLQQGYLFAHPGPAFPPVSW